MPQFDFFSFFVQILWLSMFSCTFYLIYLKLTITNTSRVLKMRKKLSLILIKSRSSSKNNFIYNKAMSFLI